MKTLKALKRVRLGNAKKLTKGAFNQGTAEIGVFHYELSMN